MQMTPEEITEQQKNEENTKKNYITPVIQERWGQESPDNIIMEYCFTDGRVTIEGDMVSRGDKRWNSNCITAIDSIVLNGMER